MTDGPHEGEGDNLWSRLRRRKVVQWGIAYAAAAWTLLQVLEYFGETYAWPRAVRQISGLALPLGLLFVLVVAWYHGDRGDQRVSRPELAILATIVALVGGTLWWYVSRIDESAWVADTAVPDTTHRLPADAASIAVLPFVDMSPGKDQEYFADGMSEELLNLLAQLPQLHVIARTSSFSFKGKEVDIATIARTLNVAHVLEGSVRKSGDTVRITVQLIRASDSTHLWSQTYDRSLANVFDVQDEIAAAVVDALKIRLLPAQHLANPRRTPNNEAYNQYLLGNQHMKRGTVDGFRRALLAYQQAVALDPGFAAAHAKKAYVEYTATEYTATTWTEIAAGKRRALAAAEKAVALAPGLADGYVERGYIRAYWNFDIEGARTDMERALSLEPANADIQAEYGYLLIMLGQAPQARTPILRATELDPLSSFAWHTLGHYLISDGQWQAGREALNRALALAPDSMLIKKNIGRLELVQGHPQEALAIFRQVEEVWRLYGEAMAEHSLDHPRESQQALDELIAKYDHTAPFQIAEVHAWRGDHDKAFEWMERAYAQREGGLVEIKLSPLIASLRSDPRYAAMLEKLGLPP